MIPPPAEWELSPPGDLLPRFFLQCWLERARVSLLWSNLRHVIIKFFDNRLTDSRTKSEVHDQATNLT